MTVTRVLVTGMSGLIGGAVRHRLAGYYELSALNRRLVPGVRTFQADVADLEAIRPAFAGQDVVVHLAGRMANDDEWPALRETNVTGTYNVFEASRQAGVKRVIYASSGATISGWEKDEPYKALAEGRYSDVHAPWAMITRETPVRPTGIYGCTKVWGEALARDITDSSDMSILCVRFGAVHREDRPQSVRDACVWCSQRDAAQMVERCIAAPDDMKFDIVYATSNNRWGYRDISHARDAVGFEPEDSADAYRP